MTPQRFRLLVIDALASLTKQYGLQIAESDEAFFYARFDGTKVFLEVTWDALRDETLCVEIGLQKGILHPIEVPFNLHELLRAGGHYHMPEAQLTPIIADEQNIESALNHLKRVLSNCGTDALLGNVGFYRRLESQRELDCMRYKQERELFYASLKAHAAWSKSEFELVVSLLEPFCTRLTSEETRMLSEAKMRIAVV